MKRSGLISHAIPGRGLNLIPYVPKHVSSTLSCMTEAEIHNLERLRGLRDALPADSGMHYVGVPPASAQPVTPLPRRRGKLVSLLISTVDRYDMTVRCLDRALALRGHDPIEILWCDDISTDRRLIDYGRSLKPVYERVNEVREGICHSTNQQLLRAKGDYFAWVVTDIELPPNWLRDLVDNMEAIPKSGFVAIFTNGLSPAKHAQVTENEKRIFPGNDVFGTYLISRELLNKIGYLCEDYDPYGMADVDWNLRAHLAGYLNYYIECMDASHIGNDVGQNTPYRKWKWDCLAKSAECYAVNSKRYVETGNYYVPAPPLTGATKT